MHNPFRHALDDLKQWRTQLAARHRLRNAADAEGVDYQLDRWRDSVRSTVARLHPARMVLTCIDRIEESPSTVTLRFRREDGPLPPFRPGQYVSLGVDLDMVRTSRPLSISSAPGVDWLDLTVREKPGGFVSRVLVRETFPGRSFHSSGPMGSFGYEPLIDRGPLACIGGGSGVTPFISLLRHFAATGWPKVPVILVQGSRSPAELLFRDELTALAKTQPGFAYLPVISEPASKWKGRKGFITADLLRSIPDVSDPETAFLVCGPRELYDFVLPQLDALGVVRRKVRTEAYGPPGDVVREPGWPADLSPEATVKVTVEGRGALKARCGEPLLAALERQGMSAPPALCRSGQCSYCRVRLTSGQVFMPETAALRESDRAAGYIHACVAYPLTDLTVTW